MKKILIIQKRIGIGDFCIFLPFIRQISKFFNNHKIHVITKQRTHAKELIINDPLVDKIFYLPKLNLINESLWLYKFCRSRDYNKCFIFHYSLRYFLISKLSNIKKIFFYGIKKKNDKIATKAEKFLKKNLNLKKLDLDCKINFPVNKRKKKQVIFGIGGSGDDKKWNLENFVQLAKKINKEKKIKIILAGGKDEIKDATYIKNRLREVSILSKSLCKYNFKKTLSYLVNSAFYVGNDTGFMHVAAAFGLKSYGIFGETSVNYAAYNKNIIPIKSRFIKIKNSKVKTINFITPSYVFKFLNV
jgi:ADP-heptose:LPS heptosyltransferase